jgi:hypothetical protein
MVAQTAPAISTFADIDFRFVLCLRCLTDLRTKAEGALLDRKVPLKLSWSHAKYDNKQRLALQVE